MPPGTAGMWAADELIIVGNIDIVTIPSFFAPGDYRALWCI